MEIRWYHKVIIFTVCMSILMAMLWVITTATPAAWEAIDKAAEKKGFDVATLAYVGMVNYLESEGYDVRPYYTSTDFAGVDVVLSSDGIGLLLRMNNGQVVPIMGCGYWYNERCTIDHVVKDNPMKLGKDLGGVLWETDGDDCYVIYHDGQDWYAKKEICEALAKMPERVVK
jgi:hypothetical protein